MDEHLAFSDSNEFTQEFRHILACYTDERIRVSDGEYGEVDQGALDFGRFLRDLRAGRGWTQAQLADNAKIPEATLFALEHGIIISTKINRNVLFALAKALDEDIDDFALILGREIPHPGFEGLQAHTRNTSRDLVSYFGSKVGAIIFVLLVGLTMATLMVKVFTLETLSGRMSNTSRPSTLFYASTLDYSLDTPHSNALGASLQTAIVLTLFLLLLWYAIVRHNLLIKLIKQIRQAPRLRVFEFVIIITFFMSLISLFRCYYFESCIAFANPLNVGKFSPYGIWSVLLATVLALFIIVRGSSWLLRRITSHQLERGFAFTTVLILFSVLIGNFSAVYALENNRLASNAYDGLTHFQTQADTNYGFRWILDQKGKVLIDEQSSINPLYISHTIYRSGTSLSYGTSEDYAIIYRYDEFNRLTALVDPEGATTNYEYNDQGLLIAITDPMGAKSTREYNEQGDLVARTDPSGATTTFEYDDRGLLIAQIEPSGAITTYEYDDRGLLIKVTESLGFTFTQYYDKDQRLIAVTDALGSTWSYTYDGNGNLATTTDPSGVTITYNYDEGRLISKTTRFGIKILYEYDNWGRLKVMTVVTGTMAVLLASIYSINNELSGVISKRFALRSIQKRLSVEERILILKHDTDSTRGLNVKTKSTNWNTSNSYDLIKTRLDTNLTNESNLTINVIQAMANKFALWGYVLLESILAISLFTLIFSEVIREGRLISAFRRSDDIQTHKKVATSETSDLASP